MDPFTNETIDTTQLPKLEEVSFSGLHPSYWKVMCVNLVLLFVVMGISVAAALYNFEELRVFQEQLLLAVILFYGLIFWSSRIGFLKKGFAFRNHDLLYRSGILATNTIIIPYNRVQHVALHEGIVSRFFGLAKIEIFTAGGSASDIEISGIAKEQAENIKQLLMGKIQKQL